MNVIGVLGCMLALHICMSACVRMFVCVCDCVYVFGNIHLINV